MPGQQHPVYSDSQEVLWLALEQLMFVDAPEAVELPLAWFEYHIQSRFSGNREAQGFLLTDRRLIVKDGCDGVFGKAAARSYPW